MPKYRLYDADGNDLGEMRLGDAPWKPGVRRRRVSSGLFFRGTNALPPPAELHGLRAHRFLRASSARDTGLEEGKDGYCPTQGGAGRFA